MAAWTVVNPLQSARSFQPPPKRGEATTPPGRAPRYLPAGINSPTSVVFMPSPARVQSPKPLKGTSGAVYAPPTTRAPAISRALPASAPAVSQVACGQRTAVVVTREAIRRVSPPLWGPYPQCQQYPSAQTARATSVHPSTGMPPAASLVVPAYTGYPARSAVYRTSLSPSTGGYPQIKQAVAFPRSSASFVSTPQQVLPRCPRGHPLECLGRTRDDGWACDGRLKPEGCQSGTKDFGQTAGMVRHRCEQCDYDLCQACSDAFKVQGLQTQRPRSPPKTLQEHAALSENRVCADCGAANPEWASLNHGTIICISCAGFHRSLGAHISKVRSLSLDVWKPEEVKSFLLLGGNTKVNQRLLGDQGMRTRPQSTAERRVLDEHIRVKYKAVVAPFADPRFRVNGPAPPQYSRDTDAQSASSSSSPSEKADSPQGLSCYRGLVTTEVEEVDLVEDRAADLRMFGPMFLSMYLVLSLGSEAAKPTSRRRGSKTATWAPPERRDLLWDAEERWLWVRLYDGGDFRETPRLAGVGRIDLLQLATKLVGKNGTRDGPGKLGSTKLEVNLFAPPEEGVPADGAPRWLAGPRHALADPEDPALGLLCGTAKLKVSVLDMAGNILPEILAKVSAPAAPSR